MGWKKTKRKPWRKAVRWLGLILVAWLVFVFSDCRVRKTHRFDRVIVRAGEEYDIDPFLLREVIRKESGFDPYAVGEAGERGLMQLTEGAAQEWCEAHDRSRLAGPVLHDPTLNIRMGSWYLARAMRRWGDRDDPVPFALAEYNAGRTHALRWAAEADGPDAGAFINAISFPTTRRYVETIHLRYQKARKERQP